MNDKQKEVLSKKLVDLVNYQVELEGNKREMMKSLTEQIKACKKRIECLGEAMDKKDITILVNAFDEMELDYIMRDAVQKHEEA